MAKRRANRLPRLRIPSRSELKRFLKARLARQFYGDEGFYTIWNQEDEMVKEAVRLLRTENPLVAARKEKE
ncbi:MAG: hypothetical protein R2795_00910 [Saprospiraceae bacterium]